MNSYTLPALALKHAIRGAVARGYCHEPNATKVLDPALCDAIASEVQLALMDLFAYERPPQPSPTGPSPLDNQSDLKSPGPSSPTLDNGCATPFGGLEKLTSTPTHELNELEKRAKDAVAAWERAKRADGVKPTFGELGLNAKPGSFRSALSSVINQYSRESGSDTPDFILAEYLDASLAAFDATVQERSRWYAGRDVSAWERRREERMEAMAVKAAKAAAEQETANLQTPNPVAPVCGLCNQSIKG